MIIKVEVMLGELLEPIVQFAAYWTGKPIVRILSLGRLHVALLTEPDEAGKRNRHWYSLTFTRGSKRFVEPEWVSIIGMLGWGVVVAIVVLLIRLR
jgi:hypothetical protein